MSQTNRVATVVRYKRRRADIVGKELSPYGEAAKSEAGTSVPFKDRSTDELAWREQGSQPDRRKKTSNQRAPVREPKIEKLRPNSAGVRAGYNPYESGQLLRPKNPGTRRDLRELGQWLKGRSSQKGGVKQK